MTKDNSLRSLAARTGYRRSGYLFAAGLLAAGVLGATAPAAQAQTGTTTTTSFVLHNSGGDTPITTAPFGSLIYQLFSVKPDSGSGVPTGTITVLANNATYPPGTLALDAQGNAEIKTINPVPNSYDFAATYSGDSTFSGSVGTARLVITPAIPTITLTSSGSTVPAGTKVTLTAAVDTQSFYQGPTGTVTFFSGSSAIGSPVNVVAGIANNFPNATATLQTTLPPGSNSITAVYSGDLDFATVTSSAVTVDSTVTSGLQFIPVTPCRIADTRFGSGQFGAPEMAAQTTRSFAVPQSACSIPTTAVAYSLNVTVVPNTKLDYLTLWPAGQSLPNVSTLNSDGRIKANAAIVPAGVSGAVSVFVSDTTNVILDINGYFVANGTMSALGFYPVTPCRVVDTRIGTGPLAGPFLSANVGRDFPLLSGNCNLPSNATAYSLNVTVVPHTTLNYLTAWPSGTTIPNVSTLNAPTGAITANAAIVPAASDGDIALFATNDTDLILDVDGYFAAPASGSLSLYPVTPCRVMDSRFGLGPVTGPVDGVVTVNVEGSVCAPSSTAQAYVLNATVVPPGSLNHLILWPAGTTQPNVSTLNALDGATSSNMAIVPASSGSIDLFTSDPSNVILDISSYFAP